MNANGAGRVRPGRYEPKAIPSKRRKSPARKKQSQNSRTKKSPTPSSNTKHGQAILQAPWILRGTERKTNCPERTFVVPPSVQRPTTLLFVAICGFKGERDKTSAPKLSGHGDHSRGGPPAPSSKNSGLSILTPFANPQCNNSTRGAGSQKQRRL